MRSVTASTSSGRSDALAAFAARGRARPSARPARCAPAAAPAARAGDLALEVGERGLRRRRGRSPPPGSRSPSSRGRRLTPRPYSTGTSARKRSSCWAQARSLPRAERRRGEARQRAADSLGGRRVNRSPPRPRLALERGERGARARAARRRRAPGGSAARGSRSSRRPARRPRPVAPGGPAPAASGLVEQLAQARLVGVEQVLAHGRAWPRRSSPVAPRAGARRASRRCPGRVKRVAVRNSRSSSQRRAVARVAAPHRATRVTAKDPLRSAARAAPRAPASATSSLRAAARSAAASAATTRWSAGRALLRIAAAQRAVVGAAGALTAACARAVLPTTSSVCASERPSQIASAARHGGRRPRTPARRREDAAPTHEDGRISRARRRRGAASARSPARSRACPRPARPAGDRLGAILRLAAQRVGVLGVELRPSASSRSRRTAYWCRSRSASPVWRACCGVGARDRRLDVLVDEHQPAEDVADVLKARGRDERLLGGLVAGDRARVLPRAEVLGHRRRHDDERGERVLRSSASTRAAAVSSSSAVRSKSRAAAVMNSRVRHGLAELDLAVAVEVGRDALGGEALVGAEGGGLDQVVEVARAARRRARRWS